MIHFSGSYLPTQVQFLLQQTTLAPTDTHTKERLIQSGQKHYSQMIGKERPPSDTHQALYLQSLAQEGGRYANEVLALARGLIGYYPNRPIVLLSLVRAGVPLGVLLNETLTKLNHPSVHYGISIIRDKGIDMTALNYVIDRHGVTGIVFVDGWTGKGAITAELIRSLGADPRFLPIINRLGQLPLVTLADVAGCGWLSASMDDWLIPSGILGATVSGLVSRSILPDDDNLPHQCVFYDHLRPFDVSQAFVSQMSQLVTTLIKNGTNTVAVAPTSKQKQKRQAQVAKVISTLQKNHTIQNPNQIKPGIAEATRAILRRVPERILLKTADDKNTVLLRHLAKQTNTPLFVVGDLIAPYHAVTLIAKLGPTPQ